jgi:hypothetical protein
LLRNPAKASITIRTRIRIRAIRNAANADNERERITLAFTLFTASAALTAFTLFGGVFPLRVLFFA